MRARKVDTVHAEVRTAFRKCGAKAVDTFRVGDDFVDLVIGLSFGNFLVEVKTGKAKQREGQVEFQAGWPNDIYVLRGAQDVPAAILAMRDEARRRCP